MFQGGDRTKAAVSDKFRMGLKIYFSYRTFKRTAGADEQQGICSQLLVDIS